MIETTELFPGVRLHFIRDPRFKQSLMTVQFLRPMCREESAKNALWSSVLLRGSRNYPDLRDITIRLDSLYGAGMGAMVRRVGDVQASGMSMTFLADPVRSGRGCHFPAHGGIRGGAAAGTSAGPGNFPEGLCGRGEEKSHFRHRVPPE